MAFFVEVSGQPVNSGLLRFEFCLIFFPHFSFYKMLLMNRLEFSCFAVFVRIFKNKE
jgi:hypothetical protein